MSEQLIDIDITKIQERNGDEDLIDIEIGQEKRFKVNFSKLVSQSRHVRDKYKYSEAVCIISSELSRLQKTSGIKETSIEHFVKYIQSGKVKFGYEEYYDMRKLSKYFEISRLTRELDEIFDSKMCDDLNFSIETLSYSEQEKRRNRERFFSQNRKLFIRKNQ